MKGFFFIYLAALAQASPAQSSLQFVGAGYALPSQKVAEGQVITMFVSGAKTVLVQPFSVQAATAPVATSLAGFSVLFSQGPDLPFQRMLPILSVQQTNVCLDLSTRPSCLVTGISVQIPMDLAGGAGPTGGQVKAGHWISVVENGVASDSFQVVLQPNDVHILKECDSLVLNQGCCLCNPKITHSDGAIVSLSAPANVGETLVMYAVGLGRTTPIVQAGTVTPFPPPVTFESFMMQYSYAIGSTVPNSLPGKPAFPEPVSFSGLTPGQIGLYQVNFKVPSPPANALDCVNFTDLNTNGANLVLTLWGSTSLDSARICVALPARPTVGQSIGISDWLLEAIHENFSHDKK